MLSIVHLSDRYHVSLQQISNITQRMPDVTYFLRNISRMPAQSNCFGLLFFFLSLHNPIFSQVLPIDLNKPDKNITVKDGLLSNSVYGCIQDHEGFMWFFTNRGVSKYDGHQFKNFTIEDGLPTNDIWLISIDAFNRKWLHCLDRSIYYIENDKVIKATDLPRILSFTLLTNDKNGNMICQEPEYQFTLKKKATVYEYLESSHEKSSPAYPKYYEVQNRHLSYSAEKDTLFLYDTLSKSKSSITLTNKRVFRSPVIFRNCTYISYTEGLYVFTKTGLQSHYIVHLPVTINRSFLDRDNNIWVATRDNGLFLYKNKNQLAFRRNLKSAVSLSRTIPFNQSKLFIDEQNTAWVFDQNKLLFTLKYQVIGARSINSFFDDWEMVHADASTYFIKANNPKQNTDLNHIYSYYPQLKKYEFSNKAKQYSKDSILWIFGNQQCKLLSRQHGIFKDTLFHEGEERIQRVFFDRKKFIYVFCKLQLYKYNSELKLIDSTKLSYHGKNLSISAISEDPITHELWIGTNEYGLFVLRGKVLVNAIEKVDIKDIEFNHSKIIYSSEKGVFVYDRKGTQMKFIYAYTSKDGISGDQLIDMRVNNDSLITVLRNEILVFDLKYTSHEKDTLVFYAVEVDSNLINKNDFMKISPAYNQLLIQFSLFNYGYVDEVQYSYSLNNNDIWVPLESNRINLQGLAGGTYQLNVKAIDRLSGMPLASNSIQFHIGTPWWKSTYFLILINLVLLGMLFYFYKRWVQKKTRRENKMTAMELNMKELKLNALESQMNPHFIYNSLSSIQHYIQENKKEQAEYYLTRFSKLVRSYLEASRKPLISIAEEVELLERYISLEKIRYEDKFDYNILIDPDIHQAKTFINTMLLQPFIENAIQHGIFHRQVGGMIKVRFEKLNTDLRVTISDNGIGIEKSAELRKLNQHIVNSRAMEIFKEKIEVINKIRPDSIEYSTRNLDDAQLEYKGTINTIVFKKVCL